MLIPIHKNEKILGINSISKLDTLHTLPDDGRDILNKLYIHTNDVVQKKLIAYIFQIKNWEFELDEEEPPRYA